MPKVKKFRKAKGFTTSKRSSLNLTNNLYPGPGAY